MSITARGIYHKTNVLKYRVLNILYQAFRHVDENIPFEESKWVFTTQMAEVIGTPTGAFTGCLNRYVKQHLIRKSRVRIKMPDSSYKSYRWRITKQGINVYFDLRNRLEKGYTLNRHRHFKLDSYINHNHYGRTKLGLTDTDTKTIEDRFVLEARVKQSLSEQYVY